MNRDREQGLEALTDLNCCLKLLKAWDFRPKYAPAENFTYFVRENIKNVFNYVTVIMKVKREDKYLVM